MKKHLLLLSAISILGVSSINAHAEIVQDDQSMVITGFETLSSDTTINKDVYVSKDATFMSSHQLTINGDLYVWGSMQVSKPLVINGTANVLNFTVFKPKIDSQYVDGYDYGKLTAFDTATIKTLNVSDDYLTVEVPTIKNDPETPSSDAESESGNQSTSTPGKGDTNTGDTDDPSMPNETDPGDPVSPTFASCQDTMIISDDTTLSDETVNKTIYIKKGSTLTVNGDVSCSSDIYVFGTLNVTGKLTSSASVYCLHYGSMMSAGDYSYGYFNNTGSANINKLVVKDEYLANGVPEIQHTFGSWNIINDPTYTSSGTKERSCQYCDKTETESIPQLESEAPVQPETPPIQSETNDPVQSEVPPAQSETNAPEQTESNSPDQSETNQIQSETQVDSSSDSSNASALETEPIITDAYLKLNVTSIPLQKNKSFSGIKALEISDGDKIVEWTSSNPKIVTVNKKGKLTGKKTGKAIITCRTQNNATASFEVIVKNKVSLKKLSVNKKIITLKLKKNKNTFKINATKYPVSYHGKVAYKSENNKIASVSSSGKITARKSGKTKIYVKCGNKTVTIKVTVKKK